jgi:hypothetical protein
MHIEHSYGMKSEWKDKNYHFFPSFPKLQSWIVRDKDIKICFDNVIRSEYRKKWVLNNRMEVHKKISANVNFKSIHKFEWKCSSSLIERAQSMNRKKVWIDLIPNLCYRDMKKIFRCSMPISSIVYLCMVD